MKPISVIIIKYTSILLLTSVIIWWVCFYSSFNIPIYIPHIPLKIYGLCLTVLVFTTLILAQKESLKENQTLTITGLTLVGTVIAFISQVIFQFIISFTNEYDKLYYFIKGTISITILYAVFSFFVAFQLKTKRTGMLIFYILIFFVVFKILTLLIPSTLAAD
jgi:hypothetical protein